MGRHAAAKEDDYEDDEDDFESPEAYDADDDDDGDDSSDIVTCPRCRREISALAEQCPRCGTYLSEEDTPTSTFPRWVVVTAALLITAMAIALIRGIF